MISTRHMSRLVILLILLIPVTLAVPPQQISAQSVTQLDKLTASDAGTHDYFGWSVAMDRTTVVIGAYGDDDEDADSGSAYVYDCSSYPCTQVNKLTASDAAGADFFGRSVAVSGTTVVVGASGDDDKGDDSGAAYVYDCSSYPCTQVSKLTASEGAEGDYFGNSVAVDGTTVVVGTFGDGGNGGYSGAAYVYDCSSYPCTQVSKLTASDGWARDWFGKSVAVSGTIVMVGAPSDEGKYDYSGAAYVYDCRNYPCTQVNKLTAFDGVQGDYFGSSVAVDGTTVVVGAYFSNDKNGYSGAAYMYDCSSYPCTHMNKLTASDGVQGDQFGSSVAVDGTTVVVGAYLNNGFGAAYVYDCSSYPCTQMSKLTASNGAKLDWFGSSVAVSGTTAVVGASGVNNQGDDFGAVYVFELSAISN